MSSSSLEVPRRQKPEKRSKLWRILVILATLAIAVGWLIWFLRTPDDLPTTDRSADGAGVVDQPLYVGMFAVGDGFDRTITITDIEVDVEADGDVEVTPQLCRDGSLSVTTDPSGWCPELEDPKDQEFTAGDSIVLVVTASEPADVEIDRLRISFRDGIRWGDKDAGLEGATLSFADHQPGTVVEEPEDTTTERPESEPQKERDKKGKEGDGKKDEKRDRKNDPA